MPAMTLAARTMLVAVLAVCLATAIPAASAGAAPPSYETSARQALLIDFDTGVVLFEKNADAPMHPASMTKIMTTALVFDEIKAGRLSLDTKIGRAHV